jgi:hypothetical protein
LFHKDCSIPFAAAQISSSQAKATPAPAAGMQPIMASALINNATFKGGLTDDTYTITNVATTGTLPNTKTTYTYKITLPSGVSLPPQQITSADIILGLLNADHATEKK